MCWAVPLPEPEKAPQAKRTALGKQVFLEVQGEQRRVVLGRLAPKHGRGGRRGDWGWSTPYGRADRLTLDQEASGNVTYAYDAINELTTDTSGTNFSYDLTGNRTNAGYSTGTENQLKNDGTWTYTYDSEGNEIGKTKSTGEKWAFSYDNRNQMTSAVHTAAGTTVADTTVTFIYDAFGNRIEQDERIGGTTTITRFSYDGPNVWGDLSSANALQTRRLFLGGQSLARVSGTTASWYRTDHEGSVRLITNNTTGVAIDTLTYDGYGNVKTESSTANGDRLKFTGREFDSATGLQYNHERFYDAKTGRWTSQDPIGFEGGDFNLYRYVKDGPTNATDPRGLESQPPRAPFTDPYTGKVIGKGRVFVWLPTPELARSGSPPAGYWIGADPETVAAVARIRPGEKGQFTIAGPFGLTSVSRYTDTNGQKKAFVLDLHGGDWYEVPPGYEHVPAEQWIPQERPSGRANGSLGITKAQFPDFAKGFAAGVKDGLFKVSCG